MSEPVDRWVDTVANAVNKLGIQTLLVFFAMGLFTGTIPSALTTAHDDVLRVIRQNQVVMVSVFSLQYAECLNKAEAAAKQNEQLWQRFSHRCEEANVAMMNHFRSLGIETIRRGDRT